ncbi:helix-turn-helix transcriptional regulator [Pseudomonas sp. HY7a-MNA-CIBAN-0227]|uniref:helix-turn-helix domain-containing protein n=1 Tax=Pseudomonas sp. HY7a-MNA-CIBAN-0227 TaxID=3140474 RepID=UPI003319EDE3
MSKTNVKDLAGLVGQAIARQRSRCGLTQEEVAERLGVGNEAVSRIERGIVIPNIERLFVLASIFGCETADFLSEASARPEDQSRRVYDLLSPLGSEDRRLIVGLVERLAERLGRS